jgi:hypothetical protein
MGAAHPKDHVVSRGRQVLEFEVGLDEVLDRRLEDIPGDVVQPHGQPTDLPGEETWMGGGVGAGGVFEVHGHDEPVGVVLAILDLGELVTVKREGEGLAGWVVELHRQATSA